MKTIDKILAESIRARRIAMGLTQNELAEKANLNVITVNRIENGTRGVGKVALKELARALGCEEHELLGINRTPTQLSMIQTMAHLQKELDQIKTHPLWVAYEKLGPSQRGHLETIVKDLLAIQQEDDQSRVASRKKTYKP